MQTSRRRLLAATAAALASRAVPAQTRPYPGKTITILVPFAPGGNIDTLARTLAVPLSKALGQSVVVDNRAGGGGAVGTALAARAEPDGHSLLVTTTGQFATLPQMIATQYKATDFEPLCVASRTPMLLMARRNDSRFRDMAEFMRFVRSSPRPLSAGHAGPGTVNHLALLQLETALGSPVNAIAYRGSGPALVDLLGGQIDLVLDQVTSSMPHIKAGTLQALAVMLPESDPALPGVPSLQQAGLATFDSTTYVGVLAPARTPAHITAALAPVLKAAVADPTLERTLRELGSAPFYADPAAFRKLVKTEEALSAQLIKNGRLKPE